MDTPLTEWKQDYHWMTTESSNDDLKKCWRSLAKMVTPGAWQERRAIRAERRAAQLEAERDEARAKLALVKAEAEYWFTQYKLATSNTVPMEAIP